MTSPYKPVDGVGLQEQLSQKLWGLKYVSPVPAARRLKIYYCKGNAEHFKLYFQINYRTLYPWGECMLFPLNPLIVCIAYRL